VGLKIQANLFCRERDAGENDWSGYIMVESRQTTHFFFNTQIKSKKILFYSESADSNHTQIKYKKYCFMVIFIFFS
jgi:tRNA(Leu) C34 or U34 (ribose-2'-O)-methylase TrmL